MTTGMGSNIHRSFQKINFATALLDIDKALRQAYGDITQWSCVNPSPDCNGKPGAHP